MTNSNRPGTSDDEPEGDDVGKNGADAQEDSSDKPLPAVERDRKRPEDGKFELANEPRLKEAVRKIVTSELFSGPIAHPKHVEHYERIHPGAAKVIFDQFQANAIHSRAMEERQMALQEQALLLQGRDQKLKFSQDRLGQILAAVLFVIGLAVAIVFGIMKYPWVSGSIVTSLLIAVIAAYLTGKMPGGEGESSETDAVRQSDSGGDPSS
ncbi:DUF2335 domain-containing protein [Burkholderia glumae]|uniref:DUF2335 domain-containing protein n=1 Tax=Burkholderia glumae TaxID=337 RepID=UPI002150B195|nr:DUF2335 domain-containing protein [Burkholderia glumae]UVS93501.1 DUF2335 domain-containing protein [Burkholderia glumae]